MLRRLHVPSYRRLKSRNLAFVDLDGKRHYLGPYGSPESKHAYQELTRQWLAEQKQPPPGYGVVLVELMATYVDHLEGYYGPMSDRRSETYNHKPVLTVLKDLYGDTLVNEVDTLALKRVRQVFLDRGLTRGVVNKYVERIPPHVPVGSGRETGAGGNLPAADDLGQAEEGPL